MLALTVLTALNTFNGGFLVASRFIYAAAREGNLPRRVRHAEPQRRAVAGGLRRWPGRRRSSRRWSSPPASGCCWSPSGRRSRPAIYALASLCLLVLRRRETRERPFRLIAGRPLAAFGVVLFTVLFLATGFSDPGNPSRFSRAADRDHRRSDALSTGYVLLVVPRLRAAAAARARRNRPQAAVPAEAERNQRSAAQPARSVPISITGCSGRPQPAQDVEQFRVCSATHPSVGPSIQLCRKIPEPGAAARRDDDRVEC